MDEYTERDIMGLDRQGNYYSRHLSAMTGEQLHDKSDIAAELAWRDARIDELSGAIDQLLSKPYVTEADIQRARAAQNGNSKSKAKAKDK
ncbi:hypothetical protein [Vreelandella sulfidaeris]|uniref:Uncharacterized protein n=1 Tax=Vreelandella sulfidaeris TaxID=115553 RepID=A0A455U6N0_9GAMM|nr:hypothetical protein HSBAA_30880 [Halomonas sulfidaeris]